MENNNPNDESLVAYLVGEVTAEEKESVESWINGSEENRRYFESFRKAWVLSGEEKALNYVLDELNVEDKWNKIRQAIYVNEAKVVSISDKNIAYEEDQNQHNDQSRLSRFFLRAAIAASIILLIGLGWKYLSGGKEEASVAQHEVKRPDSWTSVVRHELNTTGKEKRVQLPDGSLIVLANKSEITYTEPFTANRDITLVGKAYFKVAHDRTKPFTVTSGDISTTALGTEFTVTAYQSKNQIIVRLYQGKVVIKALDKTNKKLKNAVYLLPGQAFVYGSQTTANVKEFKINGITAPEQIIKQELPLDIPSLPENAKGSYFMFNNQSLSDVFEYLAGLYNVKILYDKKDLKDLYLIAKYNSTDSLETILKRIATVNNLTVSKKDNAFIISK